MVERARPRIAITTGEPAGIGPEISVAAFCGTALLARCRPVLIGDFDLLVKRALGRIELMAYGRDVEPKSGALEVIDVPLASASTPGILEGANVPAVLRMLDIAIDGAASGEFAAVVTAPLQKSVINQAGIAFSGHTEYFAQRLGVAHVVMMLAGGGMRVALATTHLALSDVPAAITQASLERTLRILLHDLVAWFGISDPRVLVAGLNPHAGESGHLGREEIEVIEPVLRALRAEGFDLAGPLPADTAFAPAFLERADVVVAMYHDQGLPVLKHVGFGNAVNVTLGLPILRTSVDHGTALGLARSGRADAGSLRAALALAVQLTGGGDRGDGNPGGGGGGGCGVNDGGGGGHAGS